ncbi:DUF4249 domain-containing protein [Chitinophaga sp. HK235]|uniref:DUF4249 domain-containing protein n=1 Tax=Chitinophaga sp. HK235 TaxID=2952571 RepID=UPI001BA97C56|nr:DUF4249 domain-containing protein [Chitinophaga sp. HK235]
MRMFFAGGILLLAGLLTSCEQRVNIQLPYDGDKIVVNSLLQPDSVAYIRVTRSVPANVYDDSGFQEISNAQVVLQQDGVDLTPLQSQVIKGRTYFVSKEKMTTGKVYTIKAAASGMIPVSGEDTLPPPPVVYDPATQRGSTKVQFILEDRAGVPDYYQIRLFTYGPDMTPDTIRSFRLDPVLSNNLIDAIANSYYPTLMMSDTRFDGKTATFVLETDLPINASQVMVEVSALTKNAYLYFRSISMQQRTTGGLITEPVTVFTNVRNGYGIVAGINSKRLVFKAE